MKFTNPAPRDCADAAPQLTALFDGEADEAQARAARAHLLSCPACSRQWLDWTRYRDTFRSEPAPVVPPTLLWRVLIAYRITAFARPARRRSRLPQVSAAPLRGIEAPLPPRLSAHILARTTRKPNAHVMLTPMQGAPVAAKSRFKGRSFKFRHAPLWAAPALALWVLMLSRADFNASLPVAAPDIAALRAPEISPPAQSPAKADLAPQVRTLTPIPVAANAINSRDANRAANRASLASGVLNSGVSAPTPATSSGPIVAAPRQILGARLAIAPRVVAPTSRAATPVRAETSGGAFNAAPNGEFNGAPNAAREPGGLDRAFALAINAGQSDIARARTAPVAVARRAPVAPTVAAPRPPVFRPQSPVAPVARTAAPPRATRVVPTDVVSSRVTLAALASPISPIRTLSSARLRTATFSDDSMRPRVAHPRVAGRRLARLMPDEDETQLRVSRPIVQAPTLRQANFGNADNGPKLDELRSAVDDFRASIASDE